MLPCSEPFGASGQPFVDMNKYALVCLNEDARVVSVQIKDSQADAFNEMKKQLELELRDAEECGFEPSYDIDDDYANLSYGDMFYAWEIKQATF